MVRIVVENKGIVGPMNLIPVEITHENHVRQKNSHDQFLFLIHLIIIN